MGYIDRCFIYIARKGSFVYCYHCWSWYIRKRNDEKIRDLYLDNLIKYIGPIPYHSLPEIYCTLDLFIFPTCLEESLGLVGLEAMACEVPVIGSYIGGLKDYIKDKENGFFFTPGNAEELSNKIELYLSLSSSEKQKMTEAAKRKAQRYASEIVGRELYAQLLRLID